MNPTDDRSTAQPEAKGKHLVRIVGRSLSWVLCAIAAATIFTLGLMIYYEFLFVAVAYTRPILFGLRSGGPNMGHWVARLPASPCLSAASVLAITVIAKEAVLSKRLACCIVTNLAAVLLSCVLLFTFFIALLFS
ncbi:hypothetical protein OT109_06320 [Phycisphaeraceae bacterium D3-23]